jgi:hypothetical protein
LHFLITQAREKVRHTTSIIIIIIVPDRHVAGDPRTTQIHSFQSFPLQGIRPIDPTATFTNHPRKHRHEPSTAQGKQAGNNLQHFFDRPW